MMIVCASRLVASKATLAAARAVAASDVSARMLSMSVKVGPEGDVHWYENHVVLPMRPEEEEKLKEQMAQRKKQWEENKAKKEKDADVRHHMWE